MSATNSTGRAYHLSLMSSASRHAVIAFDVPPTASHQNNSEKLVRANVPGSDDIENTGLAHSPVAMRRVSLGGKRGKRGKRGQTQFMEANASPLSARGGAAPGVEAAEQNVNSAFA